ncbi:MAG: hypothetical protein AB7V00_03745 [Bacilli bacterium]
MINKERFKQIINDDKKQTKYAIGTLSEKTIHRVLKTYLEPDSLFHEIKIGNYYADIYKDGQITEIQTGNFNKLREKLSYFLNDYHVEIVFPTYEKKWLLWLDEKTQTLSKPRLSPSRGSFYRIFPELYKIKEYLIHPHFHLRIFLIDWEEHRFLNGWSLDRKKGSVRKECLPIDIKGEVEITSPSDYIKLVPLGMNHLFTTRDFSKSSHLNLRQSQIAVLVLHFLKIINKVGKQGRLNLYEINQK